MSRTTRRIAFTVTNDLSYDQRMDRICQTLSENGFACELIGRRRQRSIPLQEKSFEQVRLECWFDRGKLFYLEYNLRLLVHLMRNRYDILCAIDLDTILPAIFAARLKGLPLVYDAHEYFTEMEEVVRRPVTRFIWRRIERFAMSHVQHAYTISEGYADLFQRDYPIQFEVIRNVPRFELMTEVHPTSHVIQYQGALNIGRGIEESIAAMAFTDNLELRIVGDGPLAATLREQARALIKSGKVVFTGPVPPVQLRALTQTAWVGLTLFSETGLHHRYSLANRFFDYLHAGIPQIAMRYPEYERFNAEHEVAILIDDLRPETIAAAVNALYFDPVHYQRMRENCHIARLRHCWEIESQKLIRFYENV